MSNPAFTFDHIHIISQSPKDSAKKGALSRGAEGRRRGEIAVLCRSARRRQYRTDAGQTPPHVVVQFEGIDLVARLVWWHC